jgi:hypothetical protein
MSGRKWLARLGIWSALLLAGLLPPLFREANDNEAWALFLADRVLDGARHGADFFEINPPLFIWNSIPAVVVHRALGISSWVVFVLMVGAAAFGSLMLAARLLREMEPTAVQRRTLILGAAFAFLILPRADYSEREHLALILTVPFVLLAGRRIAHVRTGVALGVVTGLVAGIGFSLKPHFLLPWLLFEVYLISRVGRDSLRRPELHGVIGLGMVYAVVVATTVPDYLPMALRLRPVYAEYLNIGLGAAALQAGPFLLLICGYAGVVRLVAVRQDPLRNVFTIAFTGYLVAAVFQGKGFGYHYLAAWGFGILVLLRGWQTRPAQINWLPSGIVLRLGFALLLAVPMYQMGDAVLELSGARASRFHYDPNYPLLLPRMRRLAAGETVIVLSSTPRSAWPLVVDAGARWGSRYMSLWPLASLYRNEVMKTPAHVLYPRSFERRTGFERRFNNEIVEDFDHYRPRVMLVLLPDSTPEAPIPHRFDYLSYFRADPRFRALVANYSEVERIGGYAIWMRESENGAGGSPPDSGGFTRF